MTDFASHDDGVSRRNLILGLGAAAGATAFLAGGAPTAAAEVSATPFSLPRPEVLGAPIAGLSYMTFDALAFFTDSDINGTGRFFDSLSGMNKIDPPGYLSAPLPLPVGTAIRQVNVAYQGQPIFEISKRPLTAPPNPVALQLGQQTLAAGGGAKSQTIDLTTPIVIEQGFTYALRFFVSAGSSLYGASLGYQLPTQGFVPFSGADPRVLDTRNAGGKLLPTEERVVNLGMAGARSAVFNLAVTDTDPPGGFVACFRADVAYPNNASINWSGAGAILSNGVICQVDAAGAIKIRGGANPTHVVIDRIGFLV